MVENSHICTTSSFDFNMRIGKVEENGEWAAISSHRQLCFNLEEKLRFSGGEMVFQRLDIRFKARNVADIESKSIRGSVKAPKVASRGAVRPGDI